MLPTIVSKLLARANVDWVRDVQTGRERSLTVAAQIESDRLISID